MTPNEFLTQANVNSSIKNRIQRKIKNGNFSYLVETGDQGKKELTQEGEKWLAQVVRDMSTGTEFDIASVLYFRNQCKRLEDEIKLLAPQTFSKKESYTIEDLAELFCLKVTTIKPKLKTMQKKHSSGFTSINPCIVNEEGLEWLTFNYFAARYAETLKKEYFNDMFVIEMIKIAQSQ